MSSIQYTIRSIPPKLDSVLRQRARKTGKSLNEIVIETLEKGSGTISGTVFNDLDWFIGSKSLDDNFNDSINWLDDTPKELK